MYCYTDPGVDLSSVSDAMGSMGEMAGDAVGSAGEVVSDLGSSLSGKHSQKSILQ